MIAEIFGIFGMAPAKAWIKFDRIFSQERRMKHADRSMSRRRAFMHRKSVGVLRKAPHPNAAVPFYDFMLSDGQPLLAARQQTTTRKSAAGGNEMPGTFIGSALSLDRGDQWKKQFEKAFGRAGN
jgi:hypothetical protein